MLKKTPRLGRILFLASMVAVFFFADDQSGPWMVVIGGTVYWTLYRVRSRFIRTPEKSLTAD